MNPLEQRVQELEQLVQTLLEVRNVAFIEELRRRLVDQGVADAVAQLNLGDLANVNDDASTGQVIKKQSNGTWAGANDNTA